MQKDIFPYAIRDLKIENAILRYIDEGRGPIILLLPGALTNVFLLKRLIGHLKNDFRVLALDFPGFGFSEAKPDFHHGLEAYARCVVAFCEQLKLDDITFFVNDSSGSIGLYAAGLMPEHIARFVIVGAVGFELRGRFVLVKAMLKYVVSSRPFRWINKTFNLLAALVALTAYMKPLSIAELKYNLSLFPKEKREWTIDVIEEMGQNNKFMVAVEKGIRERLSDKPALLMNGLVDPVRWIGAHKKFMTLFTHATYYMIPWDEHFPYIGSAELVARHIIDWAKQQGSLS